MAVGSRRGLTLRRKKKGKRGRDGRKKKTEERKRETEGGGLSAERRERRLSRLPERRTSGFQRRFEECVCGVPGGAVCQRKCAEVTEQRSPCVVRLPTPRRHADDFPTGVLQSVYLHQHSWHDVSGYVTSAFFPPTAVRPHSHPFQPQPSTPQAAITYVISAPLKIQGGIL